MANVTFFSILADLSVATHHHVLPPNDSWKAPQQEGDDAKQNYIDGVGKNNWGAGIPVADGIV